MYSHPLRLVVLLALLSGPTVADEAKIPTDANVVTGLDISDSVMRHDEWLQFQGLAKAVRHPDFLRAVAAGRHRRVGFAVFAWSSDGAFAVIVPWSIVGSAADSLRVAALLDRAEARPLSRTRTGRALQAGASDRRTDLSAAVDFASALASRQPFTGRTVVNIAANGIDNVGAGPRTARDRAVAAGLVVNGLVIGARDGVAEHFRANLQGGPGSFVAEVFEPADLADAMLQKLLRDLISATASGSWT